MLLTEKQKLKLEAMEKHLAEQLKSVKAAVFSAHCQGNYASWVPLNEEAKRLEKRHDFVKQLLDLESYWEWMLSAVPSGKSIIKLQKHIGCQPDVAREALTITGNDTTEALGVVLKYDFSGEY